MPYTRQVNRPTRAIERPRFYKPNSNTLDRKADNIINEAFIKNMNELANKHKEAKDINNNIKCATCRNASFDGLNCYYAALHPSDKRFKSKKCIPAAQAIKNCAGYQRRAVQDKAG